MASPSYLTCLCGLINEPASILAGQSLQQENCMCHCDTCRYQTGSLGTWFLDMTGPPSEKSLSNATAYETSEVYARFFCNKCGCNVFARCKQDGRWLACAGILEVKGNNEGQRNVSEIAYHEYAGDPKDGGIAPFLMRLGNREVPCYKTEPKGKNAEVMKESTFPESSSAVEERGEMLEVSCHCGSCQLRIAPAPYKDGSEGWYVPKGNLSKYYARICCCRSCRLTLGFTLQPWSFILPSQIFTTAKEPVVFGPEAQKVVQIEKLKHYQSSESVLRSFCTECGATIFYQSFDRPYIIDVSVGVLRSKLGNGMVSEWLEWDKSTVSNRGEAMDEELVEAWSKN